MNDRNNDAPVSDLFIERWSPRSFDENYELSANEYLSLFEAARWSPSCFNEQPWRFVVSKRNSKSFGNFTSLLNDFNKEWAKSASLLGFIIAKKDFTEKNKPNEHAQFDAGAAWMSLTLQARKLGLHTHGMGGIQTDKIYKELDIDKDQYDLIAGFAVGKKASKNQLPDELAQQEELSSRKHLDEILFENDFKENNSNKH